MKGLAPGTTYYYRVGDGESKWSQVFSFTTMKVDDIITYAVLGDMDFEQNNTLANVISLVEAGKVQCVLFAGDESYAVSFFVLLIILHHIDKLFLFKGRI